MRGLELRPLAPLLSLQGTSADGHDKPFILDNGETRYLYFSFDFIQSAMRISDPDALDLRYTQKMMAFLLFRPEPAHIAIVGLGGGSIAKFCYRRLPEARVTAVEINPYIVALRREFCIPDDDARLRIIEGDGAAFVAGCEGGLDVLMVDAYDRDGIAPALATRDFVGQAFRSLAPQGVLVFNLAGHREGLAATAAAIIDIFGERVLAVQIQKDEHHLMFAFRDESFVPRWRDIGVRAEALKQRFGLDFPAFARKLERSARAQLAWTLSAALPVPAAESEAEHFPADRIAGRGDRRHARRERPRLHPADEE